MISYSKNYFLTTKISCLVRLHISSFDYFDYQFNFNVLGWILVKEIIKFFAKNLIPSSH